MLINPAAIPMVVFPIAKINIGLYVTRRRDDGYHDIETVFYPIGFSDILEVIPDPQGSYGSIDLSLSGIEVEGNPESNLVVKAYRMLHELKALPAVNAYLHKRIPTGAGLGGGSSDGSSMLLVLNREFRLGYSPEELALLALRLGSDCPFFIHPEASFASGRGERLLPAEVNLRGYQLMLFHPGTGIGTAGAFQRVKIENPMENLREIGNVPVGAWRSFYKNAFEPFAFEQLPVIAEIRKSLYDSGAIYASMTGSGSAVFGIFGLEVQVPAEIAKYLIWQEIL